MYKKFLFFRASPGFDSRVLIEIVYNIKIFARLKVEKSLEQQDHKNKLVEGLVSCKLSASTLRKIQKVVM